jgi:hypothetical protein
MCLPSEREEAWHSWCGQAGADFNSIKYIIAFKQVGQGVSHLVPISNIEETLTPGRYSQLADIPSECVARQHHQSQNATRLQN